MPRIQFSEREKEILTTLDEEGAQRVDAIVDEAVELFGAGLSKPEAQKVLNALKRTGYVSMSHNNVWFLTRKGEAAVKNEFEEEL